MFVVSRTVSFNEITYKRKEESKRHEGVGRGEERGEKGRKGEESFP